MSISSTFQIPNPLRVAIRQYIQVQQPGGIINQVNDHAISARMGVIEENKGLTSTSTDNPSAPPYQPPQQQQNHYGTFQGVAYTSHPPPPSHTVVGFPPPTPPPQSTGSSPYYFPQGYQAVPGYIVADVRQLREPKLACCGLGLGWLLFIAGFFFAAIPWYVGALILVCGRVDHREKPGLVACMVGSILAVIAIVFGATGGADSW